MAKFTKRAVVVDAFQLSERVRNDPNGWPEWLKAAWEVSAIYRLSDGSLSVTSARGGLQVHVDDWVIRGEDGGLYVVDAATFEANYTPAN